MSPAAKEKPPELPRYLLLMRHGAHQDHVLSAAGRRDVTEVAVYLRRLLLEDPPDRGAPLAHFDVWCATEAETRETATLVLNALPMRVRHDRGKACALGEKPAPARRRAPVDRVVAKALRAVLVTRAECRPHLASPPHLGTSVVLVAGNLPLLGWIAARLTGRALPMGHAELVAIELRHARWYELLWDWLFDWGKPSAACAYRGHFCWALTPGRRGQAAIDLLREKIRSKMEAAKYLASFVTATLGIQLALMADPAKLAVMRRPLSSAQVADPTLVVRAAAAAVLRVDSVPVARAAKAAADSLATADRVAASGLAAAVLLLVLSAALYFATIFAYDKLLMPHTLWADGRPPWRSRRAVAARPPSSAAWVLLLGMQRVWRWVFTPATVLLVASLLLQAGILFVPTLDRDRWRLVIGSATGVALLVAFGTWWLGWPRLGSED